MTGREYRNRQASVHELEQRQRNILPHDLIANDSNLNDILWNGPSKPSRIQTVGALAMGSMLSLAGFALAIIAYQGGTWMIGIPIAAVIAFAGVRIIYKSLQPRTPVKRTTKAKI